MTRPTEHSGRRGSRIAAATLAILAIAVVGVTAAAQEALPGEPNPPWDDGALAAEVVPGLENVRPTTWEHVLVAPDGQTLTVYFWNGPPECAGLADAQAVTADGEVSVRLRVGDVAGAEACPAIAQLYRVVLVLDERLVTGGSILDLPSG
jgi:hypothetical protein